MKPVVGDRSTPTSFGTTTDIPLQVWSEPDFRLWLALHLPDGHLADLVDEQFERTGVVVYTVGARASADYATGEVVEDDARLWGVVEDAWRSWVAHDRPDRTRLGITARADRQWVWLDHPDQPMPLSPPAAA